MKGVAKIIGPKNPKIGEENFYEVTEFHKGTVVINPDTVKWKIFKKKDGSWQEAMGNRKTGKRVSYNFSQRSYGHELLVEAYIYNPEIKAPPGIIVKPSLGIKKIISSEILDAKGEKIATPPKYGQSITLKVCTENMLGETLKLSIWERDTLSDSGHDPKDNTQLWSGISKKIDNKGIAKQKVVLSANMLVLAKKGMFDGAEHEYYLLVEADKTKAISATTKVSTEKILSPGNNKIAERETAPPQETRTVAQVPVVVKNATGVDPIVVSGTTNAVVNQPENIEGILTAYFAKEEFTKETTEAAGQHTYKFARDNNNINKNTVAKIIFDKVIPIEKANKKYAKLLDITNALTATSYKKDETITFNLYKLGANFVPIKNAPLEEEVYVVAKTFSLNGKEVTINIKEKEGILVAAGADLPVLEAKENGAEITALKATVEAGIAKVKIKLRPKADTDLTTWKEKLIKGKKEGTYNYKFKNPNTITDSNKKQFAAIILNNAKGGKQDNPKIETGKTAFVDDIEKVLEIKTYNSGDTITFDTYKPQTEYLWLKAECQGDTKKHEKEFLKKDGEYFEIGKKCPRCEDEITLKHIEDCFGVHSSSTSFREDIIKYLNQYINQRKGTDKPIHLNTCLRKAHFFAQVGAETNGISTDWIVETDVIPYAARNITTSLFGARATELLRRGQIDSFASQRPQTSLLNFLYAAENGFGNGNGNEASGDGFKFRGRGLKQLTGRGNYKDASETLKEIFPDEYVDLEADPDKVKEAKYAVLSAIAYWEKHEIWKVADTIKESTDDNIKKIRRTVNGGTAGWKKAKEFFEKAKTVFRVNECSPGKSGDWHDPVDNPIATIFTQGQSDGVFNHPGKHWGLFGNTRGSRKHAGLDLFTKTGTSIYACVDGTVYNRRWHSGYGNTITIKVKDKEAFLKLKKDYELKYESDGEIKQGTGWSENGDIFMFYAHLDSVNEYTFGQEVVCGDVLGTTGRSGVTAGTCAPHLHFEILSSYTMGVGHNYRLNSGFFVSFKAFDDQTEGEKSTQQVEAQRGQIIEVDGKNKLAASDIF